MRKGSVSDIPSLDVVYGEAMILAASMMEAVDVFL
jgi:hypothetical protein